ncbi:hypothetical protein D0T11_10075 [Hymenobacter rubripertinctus]|uniref:Uncharacterized protein n=1 Tax=Hymenobacter rubripertinctus TaxID=2029981 RepID=A0A418QYG4_9BACT|nr:hypothetical protein D0T11_10075 [Hymenobacter rubripertinctus]
MVRANRAINAFTWVLIFTQLGLYILIIASGEGLLAMLGSLPFTGSIAILLLVAAILAVEQKQWISAIVSQGKRMKPGGG